MFIKLSLFPLQVLQSKRSSKPIIRWVLGIIEYILIVLRSSIKFSQNLKRKRLFQNLSDLVENILDISQH